jgi:hypothetical protein
MKLKFYNKFSQIIEDLADKKKTSSENLIFYEFFYKKESQAITLVSKLTSANREEDLEQLKICHNSWFILVDKSLVDTEVLNNLVGINKEPLRIHLIYGSEDRHIRTFSSTTIQEAKELFKTYFNIKDEVSIVFKNNTKNVILDKVGYDKKNECWLNLKQMRVHDKSVIFLTKSLEDSKEKVEREEEINCIVKVEDEENFTIVKARLNMTFANLLRKIREELNLCENLNVNDDTYEDLVNSETPFRVRKQLDGNIIYKNLFSKKLDSDENFIDGGVRLKVEFGETYELHEICLNILMEMNSKKESKEFIGDPEKILICDLKKFICEQFNLKTEEHMVYKTSALGDPIKAIKNESQSLSKTGLKDSSTIFLKNISSELYETYIIRIYQNNCNPNEYLFKPLDDSNPCLTLNLPKETQLKTLKEIIICDLKLKLNDNQSLLNNKLRLRVVGKKLDPERILKGDDFPLKKLNIDNPSNILMEVLENEEDLKENEIQLYTWIRNVKDKSYYDKKSIIFQFNNNLASSDQLYAKCLVVSGFKNISIAKYVKFNYTWELIPEMEESGPINLRKAFNLRDGDWIGIRNEDEELDFVDDFQTPEDIKVNFIITLHRLYRLLKISR